MTSHALLSASEKSPDFSAPTPCLPYSGGPRHGPGERGTFASQSNGALNQAGHGGNIWAAARQIGVAACDILDLSTNTFVRMAGVTSRIVRSAMLEQAESEDFLHYPDPDSWRLRQALARAEGVRPDNILPGGGASELIWAALAALRPRRALFLGPLFSQYARACDALGIPWLAAAPSETAFGAGFAGGFAPDAHLLEQVAASRQEGVDLIVACSPNNPGTAVLTDPGPLLAAVGDRALLLDVSYKDFLEQEARRLHSHAALAPLAAGHVIVLGSLTKFYCCPGIRLGWLASDADFVSRAARCRPAWTVPALAESVGLALLDRTDEYSAVLPALRDDVARLVSLLATCGLFRLALPGVSFAIAVLHNPAHAVPLREFLLARHHILVRVCDTIPGMPAGFIRVQARSDLAALGAGLRDYRSDC